MRSVLAHRASRRKRATSLSTVPPAPSSGHYLPKLEAIAASILYRSPLPSPDGRPVYILNAAAFPDAFEIDYDSLLAYVLARLPGEDELLSGADYEVVFFAGGTPESATSEKKQSPGVGWYLQAYHVLSRATRKRLQKLYIVHERMWVRVLVSAFGTVVSPKFRRKIVHVNTLSGLALHLAIEELLIPPAVYLHDRALSPDIYAPYATGRRSFGAAHALPKSLNDGAARLPRILRETTAFLIAHPNIQSEGLFRIPPHSVLAGVLKEAYDRGQQFVVWKERGVTVVQPGMDKRLVGEVRLEDAYTVNLAASLIKSWYRDLRQPIVLESSYGELNERYGHKDREIMFGDLEDLLAPSSASQLLTPTSRQILTRHLLPLLSLVSRAEESNKMSAENLAICFAPALVCGSNQLEDAKTGVLVRKILQAAIEHWDKSLREVCEVDPEAFFNALQAPKDAHEYEDPLSEHTNKRDSEDDAVESREPHRITLADQEEGSIEEKPALPPRPSASSSAIEVAAVTPLNSDLPRRKPAPPLAEPPRYSKIFTEEPCFADAVVDSPASYVPANGFGPLRRGDWSFDGKDEKLCFPHTDRDRVMANDNRNGDTNGAPLTVPKRKALTEEQKTSAANPTTSKVALRGAIDSSTTALSMGGITQAAAARHAQLARANDSAVLNGDANRADAAEDVENVFRKPTWPASARQASAISASSIQSLARPVAPQDSASTNAAYRAATLCAPSAPRARAPSPGLLTRMKSSEAASTPSAESRAALAPRRLNMKKASVDDLRRLYEERASTSKAIADAEAARRSSK